MNTPRRMPVLRSAWKAANADLIARSKQIDAARERGEPTVPSLLGEEKRTNPFLRADVPETGGVSRPHWCRSGTGVFLKSVRGKTISKR